MIRRHLRLTFFASLIAFTASALLFWRYGGPYTRGIIRDKLQAIVSGHLNADLEIGEITYQYPLGVVAEDVTLITNMPDEEPVTIASFKTLTLSLAKTPFGDGPLVIEKIDIDQPTLHLIRKIDGYAGVQKLIRSEQEKRSIEQKIESIPKLSDVFHLRQMRLSKMTVRYEDRRLSNPVPLLWENLDMTIDSVRQDDYSHHFTFSGQAGDLAAMHSSGKINLDTLLLQIDDLKLTAELTKHQTASPLPPAVQQLMSRMQVAGRAELELSGTVPLRSLDLVNLSGNLKLKDAATLVPSTTLQLQNTMIDLNCSLQGSKAFAKINQLSGQSGSITANLKPLEISYDLADGNWSLSTIGASIVSKPAAAPTSWDTQPFAIELVTQITRVPDSSAVKIALVGTQLQFDSVQQKLLVDGILTLDKSHLTISNLSLQGLGGSIFTKGNFDTDTGFLNLQSKLTTIDLDPIHGFCIPERKGDVKGHVSGDIYLEAVDFKSATLKGNGAVHLREGKFGRVPILASISKTIGIGQQLFIAESADARFAIESEKCKIERLSIRTKAFKIVGDGTIGFDETVDLNLYAGASGDWGKGIRDTNVPILSEIGGLIGSGTQKVVNGVTGQISAMHVTGTFDQPKVRPNPAPMLTDPIKKLFTWEEK